MRATAPAPVADELVSDWYQDHFSRISRLAHGMLGDVAAADDVAQETLVRAWQRRDELARREEIGPWLTKVARNLCVDALRRRRRFVPLHTIGDNAPDPGPEPGARLEGAEDRRDVRHALSKINDRHRRVLCSRDIEGVAYPVLATQLGIGETATRMVVTRARRAFRTHFEAAQRGVASILLLSRLRAWQRRLVDPGWVPIASALFQAACVLAISSHLPIGIPTTPKAQSARTAAADVAPAVRARGLSVQSAALHAADGKTVTNGRPAHRDHVLTVSMDRNRMQMQAHLFDPLSGQTEGVWVEVSRGSSRSTKPSAYVASVVQPVARSLPRKS